MKIEDLRPLHGEDAEIIPGLARALVESVEMKKAWKYLARKRISPTQIYRIVLYAYEGALIEQRRASPEEEQDIYDGLRHHAKALATFAKRASVFQLGGAWWQFGYEESRTSSGKEIHIPWQAFWFYFDRPRELVRDDEHGSLPIVTLTELCDRIVRQVGENQTIYGARAVKRRRYDILATSLIRRLDASFQRELGARMPSVIQSIVCALKPDAKITMSDVSRIAKESPFAPVKQEKKPLS
jgi:hypothetical protein